MKSSVLKEVIKTGIRADEPLLIKGAPGIGKTDTVFQACSDAGARLIVSHPAISDPTDYKGLPWAVAGQDYATFLPFGDRLELINADTLTVYFLDDLGQAPPAVQAATMQLLLFGAVNSGPKVSKHVRFLAATNRKADKAGVSGILEPVKSRFASIVELTVDLEDWVQWALSHGVETDIIAFIRFRPHLLHDFQPTSDITNTPCPRTWVKLSRLLAAGPPTSVEYELAAGAVGEGAAGEYISFRKIYKSLPNPDRVLMDPVNADVPSDPAVLYALCGALAQRASDQTFDRIAVYADRLPAEFSVLMVRDSLTRDQNCANTRAFIEWTSKNKDVIL